LGGGANSNIHEGGGGKNEVFKGEGPTQVNRKALQEIKGMREFGWGPVKKIEVEQRHGVKKGKKGGTKFYQWMSIKKANKKPFYPNQRIAEFSVLIAQGHLGEEGSNRQSLCLKKPSRILT